MRRYLLVALLAAACTDQGDGSIDYRVIGSFVTTHPAGLHIEPDGHATQTKPDGTFALVLDATMLQQLDNAVNAADLPTHVEYTGCCDFPDDQVVVNRDGARTLVVNRNAKDVPPARLALVQLLQHLNQ